VTIRNSYVNATEHSLSEGLPTKILHSVVTHRQLRQSSASFEHLPEIFDPMELLVGGNTTRLRHGVPVGRADLHVVPSQDAQILPLPACMPFSRWTAGELRKLGGQ
jgi:hypothetical protein